LKTPPVQSGGVFSTDQLDALVIDKMLDGGARTEGEVVGQTDLAGTRFQQMICQMRAKQACATSDQIDFAGHQSTHGMLPNT